MDKLNGRIEQIRFYKMFDYGNRTLYDMCAKAPSHRNEDEIIGKIWLIGRSHASAIERGARCGHMGDDLYVLDVAPGIRSNREELDGRIGDLLEKGRITRDLLRPILETHHFLTNLFKEITGISNRSLASKYLHFHAPDLFYIFDSRSGGSVSKFGRSDGDLKKELADADADGEYLDFISKAYPLNRKIYEDYDVWLTPRQMDLLLLLNLEKGFEDEEELKFVVEAIIA